MRSSCSTNGALITNAERSLTWQLWMLLAQNWLTGILLASVRFQTLKKKMTPKEFAKYLAIQPYCPHCGDTETLVPNHRANRGAGSPKSLNRPSNILVLCSLMNGLIESDAKAAQTARRYGWKLSKYQNPTEEPYFDLLAGKWFLLGDDFTKGAILEE